MGVFVALDLMLFFLFWELILPPSSSDRAAGRRFRVPRRGDEYMLYMLFSGVPLLFALIMLGVNLLPNWEAISPTICLSVFLYCYKRMFRGICKSIFLLLLRIRSQGSSGAVSYLATDHRHGSSYATDRIIDRSEIGSAWHTAICHAANARCVGGVCLSSASRRDTFHLRRK